MCVLKNYLIQYLKRNFFNIGIQNSDSIVNNRYFFIFSFISEKKLYKIKDEKIHRFSYSKKKYIKLGINLFFCGVLHFSINSQNKYHKFPFENPVFLDRMFPCL